MKENIINNIILKANEMDDDYLSNKALVKMLLEKQNKFDNKEQIKDFLSILANAKNDVQLSK